MTRALYLNLALALLVYGCARPAPPPHLPSEATACRKAVDAATPWAGHWRARSGDAVIAMRIAGGKVRGEIVSPVTTFSFSGGIDDTGFIRITLAGNDHWDRAEMNGTFPVVELRAGADGRSFQTMDRRKFRLCT